MIAKIKTRVDFGGIVNYANDQKSKKKCATLVAHEGVCAISNKLIADSFCLQASIRPKVKSPVKHVSLAFSSQDISRFPDNEEGDALMVEIAKKWMEQMGIRNTQYIIARHHDTKHPHCHLVFNRIDNEGNLISDSNERIRNAKVCRALTKEYGLYFVPKNSKARNKSRLRPHQLRKYNLRSSVLDARANSVEEPTMNEDGETIKTETTKETNLFIKPQNVEDNERRCSSCKSCEFASKYQRTESVY